MPPIYDDYCDDTYALKNNDNHETCHHDFNFPLDYASHDSYFVEFAPTTIDENKFAYVESNKNSMLVDHEKNALGAGYIVEFIHDSTENYYKMELSLSHTLHLFNIFRENDGKENCAQVLEEEVYKMFGIKYLNDEHDCNVVSMNSLNTYDVNYMQSHKLGDAMFDEDDIFSLPSLMSKFIMRIACLLLMMIILMKVGLEECQL